MNKSINGSPSVNAMVQESDYLICRAIKNEEVEFAFTPAKEMHQSNKKWYFRNEVHPSKSRSLQLQLSNNLSLPVLTGRKIEGEIKNEEVELERAKQVHLTKKKWESGSEMHSSNPRNLQLKFLNKISLPVLTGKKIKGEEYTPIRIALVDDLTGQVVNSGPEASAKVEIVVLQTDFDGCGGDNWTLEEFNSKIVREKERKTSLLTGNIYLNLKEGIGSIDEVYFKHTRCWMKRHQFRLGARIVDGNLGIRVREAKTEPFFVEDCRGKLYMKHHPPSLSDAVWRLEKIGKQGAFHTRLSKENINTVKDFLVLLNINPQKLKDILGVNMSAKMWDIMVDHAWTCIVGKEEYSYYSPTSQQKIAVVFNVVGQLKGLLVEQTFLPVDKLSETEKADAHKLIVSAFKHWDEVRTVDDSCR